MIEHPVPQNITEYQFHLIGNMTVKQFLILLVGVVLAFVFYSTNLPTVVKWPFVIVIVGGCIALAFVPYEERTLDQWLINFVRAIYRPTKFYWRRTAPKPDYFTFTTSYSKKQLTPAASVNQPQRQRQVSAYLSSIQTQGAPQKPTDPLDLFQDENSALDSLFDTVDAASDVTPGKTTAVEKPNLQVRARPLGSKRGVVFSTPENTQGKQASLAESAPVLPQNSNVFHGTDPNQAQVFTMEPVVQKKKKEKPQESVPSRPTGNAKTVEVEKVSVQKTNAVPEEIPAQPKTETTPPPASAPASEASGNYTDTTTRVQAGSAPIPIVFNKSLPFPSLSEKPNLLLGMVHDQQKNIIPGAIVEILDQSGNTVRAMKTNNLGQFYISTPLKKGKYTIETEANNYSFPRYALEVTNSILDPVDIQALA